MSAREQGLSPPVSLTTQQLHQGPTRSVFDACQTGPKSSGRLKAQFSAQEEGMLKLTFAHCFNLYIRTAKARRVVSDVFFFFLSGRFLAIRRCHFTVQIVFFLSSPTAHACSKI